MVKEEREYDEESDYETEEYESEGSKDYESVDEQYTDGEEPSKGIPDSILWVTVSGREIVPTEVLYKVCMRFQTREVIIMSLVGNLTLAKVDSRFMVGNLASDDWVEVEPPPQTASEMNFVLGSESTYEAFKLIALSARDSNTRAVMLYESSVKGWLELNPMVSDLGFLPVSSVLADGYQVVRETLYTMRFNKTENDDWYVSLDQYSLVDQTTVTKVIRWLGDPRIGKLLELSGELFFVGMSPSLWEPVGHVGVWRFVENNNELRLETECPTEVQVGDQDEHLYGRFEKMGNHVPADTICAITAVEKQLLTYNLITKHWITQSPVVRGNSN